MKAKLRYHIHPRREFTLGSEQLRSSPAMRFQCRQELRIVFRPGHQASQPLSIASRKIPGVIFAQQADIARNA
jgi:hypothetical protein